MENKGKRMIISFMPFFAIIVPVLCVGIVFLKEIFYPNVIINNFESGNAINFLEQLYDLGFISDICIVVSISLLVVYLSFILIYFIIKSRKYNNEDDKKSFNVFELFRVLLTGKVRNYFNTDDENVKNLRILNLSVMLSVFISIGLVSLEIFLLNVSNPFHFMKVTEDIVAIESNNLIKEEVYIMNYYKENIGNVVDSENYFELEKNVLLVTVYVKSTNEIKDLYLTDLNFKVYDFYEIEDVNYYLEEGYYDDAANNFAAEAKTNNMNVNLYTVEYTPNFNVINNIDVVR